MQFTHEFEEENALCIVRVSGEYLRSRDSDALKRFAYNCLKETGCFRFLFDQTDATILANAIQTYVAATPGPALSSTLKRLRVAVLRSQITEDDRFFETVTFNRGYELRYFTDRCQAVQWLRPKESTTEPATKADAGP